MKNRFGCLQGVQKEDEVVPVRRGVEFTPLRRLWRRVSTLCCAVANGQCNKLNEALRLVQTLQVQIKCTLVSLAALRLCPRQVLGYNVPFGD